MSTYYADGVRDGEAGAAYSPPCFSVYAQEYTRGYHSATARTITQEEWNRQYQHGYASTDALGLRYILTLDKLTGSTVLQRVRIGVHPGEIKAEARLDRWNEVARQQRARTIADALTGGGDNRTPEDVEIMGRLVSQLWYSVGSVDGLKTYLENLNT